MQQNIGHPVSECTCRNWRYSCSRPIDRTHTCPRGRAELSNIETLRGKVTSVPPRPQSASRSSNNISHESREGGRPFLGDIDRSPGEGEGEGEGTLATDGDAWTTTGPGWRERERERASLDGGSADRAVFEAGACVRSLSDGRWRIARPRHAAAAAVSGGNITTGEGRGGERRRCGKNAIFSSRCCDDDGGGRSDPLRCNFV